VPDSNFTLAAGDEIAITMEPVGTLRNRVTQGSTGT
jgi:fumarylacetoacetate (FAA) hydrolase family protein